MPEPIITYEGYGGLSSVIMAGIIGGNNTAKIRLFRNDLTPTHTTLWTDFLENSYAGYSALSLPTPVNQGLNPANLDVWRFPQINFRSTGPAAQVTYGYWIDFVNPMTSVRQSLWCQRFPIPWAWTGPGQQLPIILTPGFAQGPVVWPGPDAPRSVKWANRS